MKKLNQLIKKGEFQKFELEQHDLEIYVKQISALGKVEILDTMEREMNVKMGSGKKNIEKAEVEKVPYANSYRLMAFVLLKCLCDEGGKDVFENPEDIEYLPLETMQDIFDVCMRYNGLHNDAVKDAAKN